MPTKETPEMLLTKQMGKEAANELLGKIDKMIAKGESAEKIEQLAYDEIANHIEKEVTTAVKVAIGPSQSILVKPITVRIHDVLRPSIVVSKIPTVRIPTVRPPIVNIGPQIKVK